MFQSIVPKLACLGTFLLLVSSSCLAEKAPYSSFVKNATSAPPTMHYDYIVVGGGTAGCALAATLSQFAKVLVLERGGLPYGTPHMNKSTATNALANNSPSSPAQRFMSEDGVYGHRGRVLGGSSVLNYGFYSHARDEEVRDAGWDPQLVSESYKWVENKLVFEPNVESWQGAFRDGLLEAGVSPYRGFTYEHLSGTKVGGTIFDENGLRHSAADLLEYADPTNISVLLHATVHQILFNTTLEKPKAYGAVFQDSEGTSHTAYLNTASNTNEIILTAGALGSPQLLMLSGIGPAQQLQAQGIQVVLDQPMVGQGMGDNPLNGIVIPSPNPVELSLLEIVGITNGDTNYFEASSGQFEIPWDQYIRNQSSNKILLQAAKQVLDLIGIQNNTQGGIIVEKVAQPYSKGYLEIKSRDPNDNPKVTFNYYQDPRDVQTCVQGMQIIKSVIESDSFSKFRYPLISFGALRALFLIVPLNMREKHIESLYSMEQFCKDTVLTFWHYHGGCLLDRVVDREYRVLGVDSLRVIDASTFKNTPGTNPQATVMMLGRYMGQNILNKRNLQ